MVLMRFAKWMVPFSASESPRIREKPLRSKSAASDGVPVRVRSPAPNKYNPNQIFRIGNGFGLFVYFTRYEQEYFPNGAPILPGSKPRGPRKKKAR